MEIGARIVLVLMVVLAACGDDDRAVGTGTTEPTSTTAATTTGAGGADFAAGPDGALVTWRESGGECGPECEFALRLHDSGEAHLTSGRGDAVVAYDVGALRDLLTDLDPRDLVVGRDDCGREVDGNAPVLDISRGDRDPLTIDDCYLTIDREHPLMALVVDAMQRARSR